MNTITSRIKMRKLVHGGLALTAALIFLVVLAGLNESLGIGDQIAFWALFLVGFTLCATGPLGQGAHYGWWNPLHIAGYVLGVVLLLLGAGVLLDIPLPGVNPIRNATIFLAALMTFKGILAVFYRQPVAQESTPYHPSSTR